MDERVKELAERLLHKRLEALPERDRRVLTRIAQRAHISRNVHAEYEDQMTLGERIADKVAQFGGSWTFIGLFAVFLAAWVVVNSYLLLRRPFDPYPYIFLNLMLSMLAAIQAPVIMMSQNRQSAKDRLAATHDYEVNLKAKLEIMALHEKVDALRAQQIKELLQSQSELYRLLREVIEAPAGTLAPSRHGPGEALYLSFACRPGAGEAGDGREPAGAWGDRARV
jgi:uncharacterized membrane protein